VTGLPNLETIFLEHNRLGALHPRMFSHLINLNDLDLSGNTCIDRRFRSVHYKDVVEQELANCGIGYAVQQQIQSVVVRRLEDLEKKIDERNEEIREIKRMVEKILATTSE
jgi:hypothetical protein